MILFQIIIITIITENYKIDQIFINYTELLESDSQCLFSKIDTYSLRSINIHL